MHNLLLYLQFNPGSAATLPGIPPPNFCKQDLASLPTKSASNSKQMIWVHFGIPVKHSSKKNIPTTFLISQKMPTRCPCKNQGALNSVCCQHMAREKINILNCTLQRGRSQGQDTPNILNPPIKSPWILSGQRWYTVLLKAHQVHLEAWSPKV